MHTANRPALIPGHNRFLASLPAAEYARWYSLLEPVELSAGEVLYDSIRASAYAYFPATATVSLVTQTLEGASIEIAVVGNDGMVGISPFSIPHAMSVQAVVQSAGHGHRMRTRLIKDELNRAGPLLDLLLRYLNLMLAQVAQTALCNRFHSIDQQVCRRLLLGLDRSSSEELAMTQQTVANLLGVRREGVTVAAQKLQQDGVINYRRGKITVLDRGQLEQRSCECYSALREETDRLLPIHRGGNCNSVISIQAQPKNVAPIAQNRASWARPHLASGTPH